MPSAQTGTTVGLAIAAAVLALACFFLYRQWVEIRKRETDLTEADRVYFTRKDSRRLLGSILMMLVSVGMTAGVIVNPYRNRASGRLFGYIWLGVASLVCMLMVLAMIDWLANRDYALRHRRELINERKAILEAELRHRALARERRNGTNGTVDGPHSA